MNAETTGTVLMELDVCRALFHSLAHQLEDEAGCKDLYPLSVLSREGLRKIDGIADAIDRGRLAA